MNKLIDYVNEHFDIHDVYQSIFGKKIPTGKMFCTEHVNKNTPAAKCYGNVIHCFSCNKNYDVYYFMKKYQPQRLQEIKETVLLDDPFKLVGNTFKIVKINRDDSIQSIIETIKEAYEVGIQ